MQSQDTSPPKSNRVVMPPDLQAAAITSNIPIPNSCLVTVDNLSASTTRTQIVKMARQVGDIQVFHYIKLCNFNSFVKMSVKYVCNGLFKIKNIIFHSSKCWIFKSILCILLYMHNYVTVIFILLYIVCIKQLRLSETKIVKPVLSKLKLYMHLLSSIGMY